jgi:phosphoribosylformylglycinamidine (FGAM) synthase PurS component
MQSVELLVKLKIPDVTALTAGGALRRRMGYADTLRSLTRADYYRLELASPDAEAAEALVTELADKTNLFVNPNKHVYEVLTGDAPAATSRDGLHSVRVLVTDPADGSAEGALAALQGRLGYGESVRGLLKGVLWTLTIAADSLEQAREIAREIAVTRAREHGLLMNPHFQECVVG